MRTQTRFLRRIGAAVMAAAMALAIGVPALADDERPRDRDADRSSAVRPSGIEWTRLLSDSLDGVEWTRSE